MVAGEPCVTTRSCDADPVPRVTLVVGDEELLVARAVQRAVQAALAGGGPDVAVHDVMAAELDHIDLAELTSPSLFAEARVVVVRGAQDAGKDLVTAMTTLATDGDPDVSLVVVHPGGAKGKAVVEALRGAGAKVVEAAKIKSTRDREQFVVDEVREAGGSIDRDAAADLVASIGTDLRELSTACVQLVADIGPRITTDHVAAYYRGRAESTGFAVADRAVEGDVAAALETLRWAFATGVDPVLVSAALASNLRTIALVGAAGRGSPDTLAGPLGMPPWKVRRAQGWLKRWKPDALADAVRAVADADAGIKGAGDDAAFAAESAVITVAGCAAR
ncbi:MAG: polymerase subunit delta [Frankiaceae bacterium]|nr:polymerase subunit delta [Frankiaceae bacterium]